VSIANGDLTLGEINNTINSSSKKKANKNKRYIDIAINNYTPLEIMKR
jgi:hypothetical protein